MPTNQSHYCNDQIILIHQIINYFIMLHLLHCLYTWFFNSKLKYFNQNLEVNKNKNWIYE